jgi:hypothetical protein
VKDKDVNMVLKSEEGWHNMDGGANGLPIFFLHKNGFLLATELKR